MAVYVSDSSFSQLTKSTQLAKTMLESWQVTSYEKQNDSYFNPQIPNYNNQSGPNLRNEPGKKEYQEYLWLFGGMKR